MKNQDHSSFVGKLSDLSALLRQLNQLAPNTTIKHAYKEIRQAIKKIEANPEIIKTAPKQEKKTPKAEKKASKPKESLTDKALKKVKLKKEFKNKEKGTKTKVEASLKDKKVTITKGSDKEERSISVDIDDQKGSVSKTNKETGKKVTADVDLKNQKIAITGEDTNKKVQKKVSVDLKNEQLSLSKTNKEEKITSDVTFSAKDETVTLQQSNQNNATVTKLKLDLKNAGIELDKKKEIKFSLKPGELGKGFFKVEPKFAFKAGLTVGAAVQKDKAVLKASLSIDANLSLDVFIDLALAELGGTVALKYKGGISGSVSMNTKGKGVLKLDSTPQKLDLGFSLFLRPGDTAMEILDAISSLLGKKGFKTSDKHKYAWVIPVGNINLAEFTIPGEEMEFDALAQNGIQTNSNLPDLLLNEIKNLKSGAIGIIIDVIEFISDAIEFINGVIDAIGDFFSQLWDDIVGAFKDLWNFLTESEAERLERYLREKGQANYEIVFSRAMSNMKEKPEHLEALAKIGKTNVIGRFMYIWEKIWPAVQKDPFVKQSMKALKDGNYDLLEKNALVARSVFYVQQHAFNGTIVDGAFASGTDLKVSLDVRRIKDFFEQLEDKSNEEINKFLIRAGLDPSVFDKGISGRVKVNLLYKDKVVSQKTIAIQSFIAFGEQLSNAYDIYLPIPGDASRASTEAGGEWSVQWTIDFVGDIMDVKDRPEPIRVTHKQPEEEVLVSEEELEQSQMMMMPEMKKPKLYMSKMYKVKDDNGKNAYAQGAKMRLVQLLNLEGLHIEPGEKLEVIAHSTISYNKKRVSASKSVLHTITQDHIDKGEEFKIVNFIKIPKNDNYEDTCRGASWRAYSYIEIKGRGKDKKSRGIPVFNNKKQYSALKTTQSIENSDVLDKLDNKLGIEHKEQNPNIARDKDGNALESHPDLND